MSVSPSFQAETLHRLRRLGEITPKRMFGGVGLYCEGHFFGLLDDDMLFFKVDDESRGAYEAQGMSAFAPGGQEMRGYYEVPAAIQEDSRELAKWAEPALKLAAAATAKKARRERPSKEKGGPRISRMKNLGPVSAAQLKAVGVLRRADLERLGSAGAFRAVEEAGFRPSLNLLWALEGALLDLKWTELPEALKSSLRQRVGRH